MPGVAFAAVKPDIDERAAEAPLKGSGATPEDVALVLAAPRQRTSANAILERWSSAPTRRCRSATRSFTSPPTWREPAAICLNLSGKTHQLNSAVALVRDGETLWSHVAIARLTMRELEPAFIGRYLARVGDKALSSVGAYQIEGEGIQLFEKIEGDYFTIVGLPLLPLLAALRELRAIDG